jgi:hypothetical protein
MRRRICLDFLMRRRICLDLDIDTRYSPHRSKLEARGACNSSVGCAYYGFTRCATFLALICCSGSVAIEVDAHLSDHEITVGALHPVYELRTIDRLKPKPSPVMKHQSNILLAALALLAALVATWPPLHLVLVGANLPTYYMENIGWRFFWVQRFIAHVPGDYVHPGQGVLMPLIQSIYYLAGKVIGLDLFGQISLFGSLTLVGGALGLIVTALFIAVDDTLDAGARAALVTTPLVMALGDPQIFAYDVYPDYLAYAKILFLLFGWRWLHDQARDSRLSPRGARELGFLAGLLAALKLNYVLWPAGLLLISLIEARRAGRRDVVRLGFIIASWGAMSLGGQLLIFYHGNIFHIVKFFTTLFAWAPSLAPSLAFALDPFSSANMSIARLVAIFGILCLFGVGPRSTRSLATILVAIIIVAAALVMAYARAGSSIFDAVVMICVLCALLAARFPSSRAAQMASFAVAAAFVAWPAAWTIANRQDYASIISWGHVPLIRLGEAGDWQRGLFTWDMSRGLPVYVLTPTNYETQGTIEDMISMGGLQNFGGAPGNPPAVLRALYPQIHYLYFDSPGFPLTLPLERLVFLQVTGTPAPDFPHLDQQTLASHEKQVARALEGRRVEDCYRVTQFMTRQEIVSCVIGAKEE